MSEPNVAVACAVWYCQIPGPVATMLTGVIALLGVMFTMGAAHYRHKDELKHDRDQRALQLEHDRAQRRIERDYQMRREVYLEVAMATSRLLHWLANFASVELDSLSEKTPLLEFASLASRVQIVGRIETVKAVNDATKSILQAYSAMVIKRYELAGRDLADGQYLLDFTEWAAGELRDVQIKLVPAMCALREELEIGDAEEFRAESTCLIEYTSEFVHEVVRSARTN